MIRLLLVIGFLFISSISSFSGWQTVVTKSPEWLAMSSDTLGNANSVEIKKNAFGKDYHVDGDFIWHDDKTKQILKFNGMIFLHDCLWKHAGKIILTPYDASGKLQKSSEYHYSESGYHNYDFIGNALCLYARKMTDPSRPVDSLKNLLPENPEFEERQVLQ